MLESALKSEFLEWEKIEVNRNDFLIKAGEVEKYLYYIKDGALRAYLISEKDEEFTIRFAYKNTFITSIPSYFTGKESELYIEAIRKSTLIRTSKKRFNQYISKDIENQKDYQDLLESVINSFLAREVDLLTQSPSLRLQRVLDRSPKLFQEIPHKYIASYLRMTPETLSRLLKS